MGEAPHSRDSFTQGLQLEGGLLYESGGGYGSSLLRISSPEGRELAQQPLARELFAEGLTVRDQRIYLLTWREHQLRVYDSALKLLQTHPYPREGWGLTHNQRELITSDGSDTLYFLDPTSLQTLRSLKVTDQGKPVAKLNELEWVDGLIYANIWLSDLIVRIDPQTGVVQDHLDLHGLLPEQARDANTDVLNGIAWDAAKGELLVTGKRWPRLYRLKLNPPKNSATATRSPAPPRPPG